ncbi:MAG: glycoside hydrolase domain-containing protein [bacterium]
MSLEIIKWVLPPWTEVIAQTTEQGVDVSVWGRTYSFAKAPLPTSVTTVDEEILASPIRLVGTLDSKPIAFQRKGALLFRQHKAQAIVSGWQANDTLIVNTTSQVEFDGMMRVDMVVMPQRGTSPELSQLWLEVPLKCERVTLFHYWPGRWGSAENSGAVPKTGLALPFKPFVWLGWGEGGLSWFAESDEGWHPKDANRCIEVMRQGEEMVLRIRILDSLPPRLPLTFTFGFQATPVKPIEKEFHEWRICHGANYEIKNQPVEEGETETVLDRMIELGVKTLVFHEHWTPIQNYFKTTREAELKNLVSECHKRGIKLLLYFGYELSTLAPEWGELADEVLVKNPQGGLAGGYHRQPEQRAYIVCYKSRWQDYLVEGIAQALERYGFDGVYLDGTIEPWGCANERHGCGYRADDGSLRVSYPIFAVRRLMRQLYALIHPKGGLVNAHQSTCCVTPTLAFCHSYWDGEQFGGGELSGDSLQKLSLEAFRAEFMGKNFGVPCEFLVYERPPKWTFEHALAFTLLHDVRVRPGGFGRQLELMSKIWKAMTDFSVSSAEWHPYWRNQQLVEAQPESVKVSFYLRGSQALLVVSNLSAKQEVEGCITLNSSALGLSGAFTFARDAITGEELTLKGDNLRLILPAMRARLVFLD